MAGHSLSLFFDGTETSATTLSYALYELARNPECQEKLYEEIERINAKYDGKITYDGLQEMIYLEGVILEASRIHPPGLVLGKVCTEQYTLPKTSKQSQPVTIQPGTVVNIPILGVHMWVQIGKKYILNYFDSNMVNLFFKGIQNTIPIQRNLNQNDLMKKNNVIDTMALF